MSLWDLRGRQCAALTRHCLPPYVVLHTLCLSQARPHLLAIGGSQRGISVLDLRTLKQIERAHMAKSDVTFVEFLQHDPGQSIAAGLDQEVAVCGWEPSRTSVRSTVHRVAQVQPSIVGSLLL